MPYNIEAARKANISDQQIAEHLSKTFGYDIDSALKSGASYTQVAEYLSKNDKPPTQSTDASSKEPGRIAHAIGSTASGFNEGIANVAGFPVDVANMAIGAIGLPASEKPVMGGEWIKEHLMPKPIKPEGAGETMLNALAEQGAYIMPGIGSAARTGQLANALRSGAKFATGAGIGSGTARIAAPDNEWADVGAQVAGGLTPSVATGSVNALRNIAQQGGIKKTIGNALNRLAEKQAGKRIINAKSTEPAVVSEIDKNLEATKALEKEIPGLKLNIGQAGGDPNLLSLARQSGQMPGVGTAVSSESVMAQNQAISDYIGKNITGKGNVDDFIASIQRKKDDLATRSATAASDAEAEALKLTGRSEQDIGSQLLETAKKGRAESSKKAKELYDAVPDGLEVDSTPLWNKVNDLFGDFDKFTQRLSATPTGPAGRVKMAMEPEPGTLINPLTGTPFSTTAPEKMTMKQLKDFRSQMTTLARDARASGDYELAYKADQLKAGVGETLDLAAQTGKGDAVDKLRAATAYYRDVHVPKYRKGATGKVLGVTRTGEQKVLDSSIGGEYFKSGKGAAEAADNFAVTFGGNKDAKGLIREYASQSLLKAARNPITGELESKRIAQWLHSHDMALTRFGLKNDFNSTQKAIKMADDAKVAEYAFNKSALAKALNVDPDKAISEAFMVGVGRKQSISRVKELASLAKQDKTGAAVAGLKAAIGDYFQKTTALTARDLAGNRLESLAKMDKFMESYGPAFKASGLYTPQELAAFDNVHLAIKKISQQARPHPAFSGSPTVELLGRLAASGASIASGHIGLYGAARGAYSFIERPIKSAIDEAVVRAVHDPRYADVLTSLAREVKTIGPEKAARSFTRRIAMFGEIATEIASDKKE